MKRILLILLFFFFTSLLFAQKADSIYFHLYTDSLKKGTHNYINVDGKMPDGRWMPLTSKDILFSASYGRFEGNDLILPAETSVEKITVKAQLKNNPHVCKEIIIWIKKKPDDERLPSKNEMINGKSPKNNKGKGRNE